MIPIHIWPAILFHQMIESAVKHELNSMADPEKSEIDPKLVEQAWRIALLDVAQVAGRA